LFSIFNILISKLCNSNDIVVGIPVAGRRIQELEKTMGLFANTLAIRNNLNQNLSFIAFLSKVKENTLEAFDNQDFQFEDLISELNVDRDNSKHQSIDILFSFNNIEHDRFEIPVLITEPIFYENKITKLDLELDCAYSENELEFTFTYYKKVFNRSTIERFIEYFKNIFHSVILNRNVKLSEIHLISEVEQKLVLEDFNKSFKKIPEGLTMVNLFEKQVKETPDRIAIVFNSHQISYKDLNERTNRLSNYLLEYHVKQGDVVCIYLERSIELVIGLLAF
jgi:non-ribosomal peptide synthetase component F